MRTFPKLSAAEIKRNISRLRGSAAAVVYSFEPEKTPQKVWYDQWRSDVISFYGHSLEAVGIEPYFVDVTTYCRQALSGELPELICAFNLNAGIAPITHWAVMPSISRWAGIEPMPARADVLIVGERKDTAILMARELGMQVPKTFTKAECTSLTDSQLLIVKPRDLGGSVGVRLVRKSEVVSDDAVDIEPVTIQEFIPGYDLTVPVIYKPSAGHHIAPVGALYLPDDDTDRTWIHDEHSKRTHGGYSKSVVPISRAAQNLIIHVASGMELGPYARFDLRISSHEHVRTIEPRDIWFLEVNPLPTLRRNVNLVDVIASSPFIDEVRDDLDALIEVCPGLPEDVTEAFPIACSLLSMSL